MNCVIKCLVYDIGLFNNEILLKVLVMVVLVCVSEKTIYFVKMDLAFMMWVRKLYERWTIEVMQVVGYR